ncbi:hypothetical protein BD413DRAFT_473514 [Trametes elegans]|nr:hypothetical protein BD413DRAFT_473514 [Trametes elegans]
MALNRISFEIFSECCTVAYGYNVLIIVPTGSFSKKKRARLGLELGPLVFLNHSQSPIAKFPVLPSRSSGGKPDIIGTYRSCEWTFRTHINDTYYRDVPYHRVETIVEVTTKPGLAAINGAANCLHRLQQARPDRPGCYALCGQPTGFQVLYASPLGIKIVTALTPWDDLHALCDYVRSLYDPPWQHFTYDPTISWSERSFFSSARWTIKMTGQDYTGARILFVGYPWGSRTTVFSLKDGSYEATTLKEHFVSLYRPYDEAQLLIIIHADGDFPGIVRLVSAEYVKRNGKVIKFTDRDTGETRLKRRLAFADTGVGLEHARSVNDLLMTFYDALEGERRNILHRDMSLNNILMYPKRSPRKEGNWLESFPPLVDDILAGYQRTPDQRVPRCLLIDCDHAAKLVDDDEDKSGTPMYIARAVSAGEVYHCSVGAARYTQMPLLSERARALYVKLHGEDRYSKYNDDSGAERFHGGVPRTGDEEELEKIAEGIPFYHRWEYDAESVFWSMYSILLRVLPAGHVDDNKRIVSSLKNAWKTLEDHCIPSTRDSYFVDMRFLVARRRAAFLAPFPPSMQDVAALLFEIFRHVRPSYALMSTPPPFEDHLHEAMQRLILDYLVEHEDNPVPLTPGVLREPVRKKQHAIPRDNDTSDEDHEQATTGTKRKRSLRDCAEPTKPSKSPRRS